MRSKLRAAVGIWALVLAFSSITAAAESTKGPYHVHSQADGTTVEVYEDASFVYAELDGHLSSQGREALVGRFNKVGLEFLDVRPPGLPGAGKPQVIGQSILLFRNAGGRTMPEIRQELVRAEVTAASWCARGVYGLRSLEPVWRTKSSGEATRCKPTMVDACFDAKLSQQQIDSVISRMRAFGLVESPRELGWYDRFLRRLRHLDLEYPDGNLGNAAEMIRATMPEGTVRLMGVSWSDSWACRCAMDLRCRTDSLRVGDRTKADGGAILLQISYLLEVDGPVVAATWAEKSTRSAVPGSSEIYVSASILGGAIQAYDRLESIGMTMNEPREYYKSKSHMGGRIPVSKLNELLALPFVYHVELVDERGDVNY